MSKARGTAHRRDFPRDPAAVLRDLRAMCHRLGEIQAEVTIQGAVYNSCGAINRKIGELAGWLTGNPDYFMGSSSYSTEAQKEYRRRWEAIERGDELWPEESLRARNRRS